VNEAAPFILTLTLDPDAQAHFDRLRTAHFPTHRLVVGAHVTLFHALPGDLRVASAVASEAAAHEAFPVDVTGVRFLGRGVAFSLESTRLHRLRQNFHQLWAPRLTPQDRQRWQPHVTIQNKAEAVVARSLYERLQIEFSPYEVVATGLALWIYRNGPWEAAGNFPFRASAHGLGASATIT
jgi:2'-5' RNA ligase